MVAREPTTKELKSKFSFSLAELDFHENWLEYLGDINAPKCVKLLQNCK